VQVRGTGENSSTVSVLDAQGQPEASATAQRIVQVLADDLK
jgi:outer membrane protein assembly factor BamC